MNTYHVCKNKQMKPGTREECQKCNPQSSKENRIIVEQQARIAKLTAALRGYYESHTEHAGAVGTTCLCQECADARRLLDGAK